MSNVISLTPEQLKQQARSYTEAQQAIAAQRAKVRNTNGEMAAQWKGAAFDAYLQQYEQLEKEVKKFEELLMAINRQLNSYADTVRERDAADVRGFGLVM